MSPENKTFKLCSCNGTIALDPKRLAEALKTKQPLTVHRELCRKEAGAFQSALADPDLIVACTQEAPLFSELASAAQTQARILPKSSRARLRCFGSTPAETPRTPASA